MKTLKMKNVALLILVLTVAVAAFFIFFDPAEFEFRINFVKYHSEAAEGREYSFYGSFGSVRKVKVKENGKKLCSLKIEGDADALDSNVGAVLFCDINEDGQRDILLLTSIDADGDVHRAMYISSDKGYELIEGVDIVNFTAEDSDKGGKVVSEERNIRYLAETLDEYVVPYEDSAIRVEYEFRDGRVVPARKISVSYYTETDYYCVGTWEYSDEYGELIPISEDWMSPDEYATEREILVKTFGVELPR